MSRREIDKMPAAGRRDLAGFLAGVMARQTPVNILVASACAATSTTPTLAILRPEFYPFKRIVVAACEIPSAHAPLRQQSIPRFKGRDWQNHHHTGRTLTGESLSQSTYLAGRLVVKWLVLGMELKLV